jgi:NADPH:quinone reductase-like Zn-dependent oxidoreductase
VRSVKPPNLTYRQATIGGMKVGSTENFMAMNESIATHDIHPIIDAQFPFEETKKALEYLEKGQHFGKIAIEF